MNTKTVVALFAFVAAASAGYVAQPAAYLSQPAAYLAQPAIAKVATIDADYDPNPQYNYAYDIQDALTGDSKSQHESRSGDVVQGSYSLTDSDGYRRTVDYTADPHNGFNAVVRREPLGHAVVKAAVPVAKYVAAAPALAKVAYAPAPQAYYH